MCRGLQKQFDMWNKYVGQDGILYIHAKLGGNDWNLYDYNDLILKQPWFLEKVDDRYSDKMYCDIYARINT